jgi:hypothetical protein
MSLRARAIWFLACSAAPCLAHQDSIIAWKPDGTLQSLPAEFQPAKLLVSFSTTTGQRQGVDAVRLEIAGHKITLPRCVTEAIRVPGRNAIRVVASWYHDMSLLPPYIIVEFFDSDPQSTSPKNSRSLQFNLKTARLEAVSTAHYSAHESMISNSHVDFRRDCADEDLAAFSEPPKGRR